MAYLAAVEAIRARLAGDPRTSYPMLPESFREGSAALAANLPALVNTLTRKTESYVANVPVPVFFKDSTGQVDKSQHHYLAFDVIGFEPRFDEGAQFYSEWYGNHENASYNPNSNQLVDGEQIPGQMLKSPKEDPMNLLVAIEIYSTDPLFGALLEGAVYDRFKPRDYLRVPTADGGYRTWDMIFQDYKDLDARAAVRSGTPGVERSYKKTLTVLVEGFFDKTSTLRIANLVRERILAVSLMDPPSTAENTTGGNNG